MRFTYLAPVALLGFLAAARSANAATPMDFNGTYDIEYKTVHADLDVVLTSPKGQDYPFQMNFDLALEGEEVPKSAVDPILAEAQLLLEEYYPSMPDSLENLLLTEFARALYSAVDEINTQTTTLPDSMVLYTSVKSNPAPASSTYVDVVSGSQFVLPETATLSGTVLQIVATPAVMKASIDAAKSYTGSGTFFVNGIDETGSSHGYTAHVTGDIASGFKLARQ